MSVTVTKKLPSGQVDVIGGYTYLQVADVQFDSSYPTGGEPLSAGDLGFPPGTKVVQLTAIANAGLLFEYDYVNSKLKAFYPTGGATAAPTGVSTAPQVSSGASTASAVSATTPALTPGVGKEVGNTADLSTITVRTVAVAAFV